MERSVHDNFVLGYTVDAEARTIRLCVWYVESAIGFDGFVIATAMKLESPDD